MSAPAPLLALLRRAVDVRPHEVRALFWSFGYFFCLLCSYYILRPLRDEMGIAGGVRNLQWLFTGSFVAMLLAVPLFGAIVARLPRRRFVPLAYRFFMVNILIFFLLLSLDIATVQVARAFFIWVSLFNLFVVSVFWSLMADLFRSGQARRLFGFIAAGGTAGALLGPALTAGLAVPLGPVNLLLISVVFLEIAVQCAKRLLHAAPAIQAVEVPGGAGAHSDHPPPQPSPARGEGNQSPRTISPPPPRRGRVGVGVAGQADETIGGGVFAGITAVLRSPYLLGICLYILLYTTTSTFLYFQQAHIVAGAFDDPAERTRVFALIDLCVGLLTLLIQCFLTGRIMPRLGVGPTLGFLPLLTLLGFAALAIAPGLVALVSFQATRRAANFAISRPAREVLFTVIGPEQKYKAKNFIDTAVYRGGDAVSGWAFAGLSGLGLGLSAIALVTLPIAALWLALSLHLGRRQEHLAVQAAE